MLAFLFVALPAAFAWPIPIEAPALAFATNADLSHRLSPIDAPVSRQWSSNNPFDWNPFDDDLPTWNLTFDDIPFGYKQKITGFGAAVTDATVEVFQRLTPRYSLDLMNDLMSTTGANFALMRHTIGASDMSADPVYTYNDSPTPDPSLFKFSLGDRGTAMAKLLARMKAYNPDLEILGSSWSAPGWMKMNNATMGNATDNNLSDRYLKSNQSDYSKAFAKYFVKYLQGFMELGAEVNAITIQNEPLNSQAGYPTMYMFDYEVGNLINEHIGPAISKAGLGTKVWAYDHNTDVPAYPQTVLNMAPSYVPAVAWHCYASNVDWTVLTSFHEINPTIDQYMTECWTPTIDSSNWFQAAEFTLGPLQNWASGVIAWTLATDSNAGPHLSEGGCASCIGLVLVNQDGTYSMNMAYYLMAQFSRFMPKGATVLQGTGSVSGQIESVATMNPDGSRSIVILNKMQEDTLVKLQMQSGKIWEGVVPGSSLVTWVLPSW